MPDRPFSERLRTFARKGLPSESSAGLRVCFGLCRCGALARLAIDLIVPGAVPFATYFPAILVTALIGGVGAAIVATLLSAAVAVWLFVPPQYVLHQMTAADVVNLLLFIFSGAAIICISALYRRLVRKLAEEEGYRQVVVDELGHRVKNKLAVVLALVFHELATNAAKYGGLSSSTGGVDVVWREEGDVIAIDWREHDGPPVTPPERRSFGSKLIESSLDSFGGSARLDFATAGVICRMSLPKQRVTLGNSESQVA